MTEPAPAADESEAFASTSMVALIVEALRARAPHLVPEGPAPDAIRAARSPMDQKRELLERVVAELGGQFVFEIGRHIDAFDFLPLLQAFLRSRDGEVLLQKWNRFERYGHGRHRTRMERRGPGHFVLERHATSGPPPGPAHDLFILGLVVALLERVGSASLGVALEPGGRELVRDGVRLDVPPDLFDAGTARWELRWTPEAAAHREAAARSPTQAAEDAGALGSRVRARLALDPARSWSVAEMARALATSERSLQRRLGAEGTSFSALVRAVRVAEACRLLERPATSLTEIGFLCGFSDAAHFSRDFRASVGATPSEFRRVVASGDAASG